MNSFDYKKILPWAFGLFIAGVSIYSLFGELSRVGVIFLFEVFALGVIYLIDKLFLPKIDLVEEIVKKQNVALVLLILGLIAIPLLAS